MRIFSDCMPEDLMNDEIDRAITYKLEHPVDDSNSTAIDL